MGVLEVVSLPGHEGHFQVASESKLTALCGVSLRKYLTGMYSLALSHDGLQMDGSALVGLPVEGQMVYSPHPERSLRTSPPRCGRT